MQKKPKLFLTIAVIADIAIFIIPNLFTELPDDTSRLSLVILSLIPAAFWLGIPVATYLLWDQYKGYGQQQNKPAQVVSRSDSSQIVESLIMSVSLSVGIIYLGLIGNIDTGMPFYWSAIAVSVGVTYFLVSLIRIKR